MNEKSRLKNENKRTVHPILRKVLDTDVILTKKAVSFMLNFLPVRSFTRHCQFLEYSCHGVAWIASWLAFCWFVDRKSLYQMQINMIFGLILDIIFVGVLKAIFRRRRPTEDPHSFGPDVFSFPSGHASRSVFILGFFTMLYPITKFLWPPLLAWAASVCVSRLLLYRHHILDVSAGVLLGLVETFILWVIWLNEGTTDWLMAYISDDRDMTE